MPNSECGANNPSSFTEIYLIYLSREREGLLIRQLNAFIQFGVVGLKFYQVFKRRGLRENRCGMRGALFSLKICHSGNIYRETPG